MDAISLADGAEEIGPALMLQGLIAQNLEQRPEKNADFKKLDLEIGLNVPDAEIELTPAFSKGRLVIGPGISPRAGLVVAAEADVVMNLSNLTIRWGLPYYFDQTGREVLAAMRSGRLKVSGLRHLPSLIRFSRLMSVA